MDDAHKRIAAVLDKRFPESQNARQHFGELLSEYRASNLSAPNLVDELETGDEHKLRANVWEAMLYRHLKTCGHTLRNYTKKAGQDGPDFGVVLDGKTIWIDAVMPEPKGIPAEWVNTPLEMVVRQKPDVARVLRCTHVIREKRAKFEKYLTQGKIEPQDCTVIAVNISRLSDMDPDGMGISQRPLCMEAVLGVGPIAVSYSRASQQLGPAQNSIRNEVENANGAPVDTSCFLDLAYANISAVIQSYQSSLWDSGLIPYTVHNPLAHNPLPHRLFDARIEYVGTTDGDDGFDFNNIAPRRT